MRIKNILQLLRTGIVASGCLFFLFVSGVLAEPTPPSEIPKNIILFIGDGMGLTHVTAARVAKGRLNLEEFPHGGFMLTYTLDKLVPSSPGPTTALATGYITKSGYVGLNSSGQPVRTVLEYAREKGKSTGLVSTSAITDATPACFAAHIRRRRWEGLIAEYIIANEIDVMIGGGMAYFLPSTDKRSARKDKKDLLAQLEQTHTVTKNAAEFKAVKRPRKLAAFLALQDMPTADAREISLSEITHKAIEILSQNENGFFLMIEGSQIDWAGHHGYGEYIIQEVIDLDEAVGVALNFAKEEGDTLIIVTADHETGGYTILDGSIKNKKITESTFLTDRHSGAMVPLFAFGPSSETLGGIHHLSFIGQKMIDFILQNPAPLRNTLQ